MKILKTPKNVKKAFMPNKPVPFKKNAFGLKLPKTNYAKDSDKDNFPDHMDCQPNNPAKQGERWDSIKEKYRDWREKAPERREQRHQEKLERYERRTEAAEARASLEEQKARTTTARLGVQERRAAVSVKKAQAFEVKQKAMDRSFGGGGMGGFGPSGGFGNDPIRRNLQGGANPFKNPPSLFNPLPGNQSLTNPAPPKKVKKRKSKKKKGKSITINLG